MNVTRLPEPALIRSILVAVTGVIAFIIGHQIDTGWVEGLLTLYGLMSPIVAGVLIRPVVTPVDKRSGSGGADLAAGD